MITPTPHPQVPGHIQICYYCHEVITTQVSHNGVDRLFIVLAIAANVCIILSFMAAWIRHRMRIAKKLEKLEAEIEEPGPEKNLATELIVYARLGHFALVKIPTHVMVRVTDEETEK